jgi:hypothetical protein
VLSWVSCVWQGTSRCFCTSSAHGARQGAYSARWWPARRGRWAHSTRLRCTHRSGIVSPMVPQTLHYIGGEGRARCSAVGRCTTHACLVVCLVPCCLSGGSLRRHWRPYIQANLAKLLSERAADGDEAIRLYRQVVQVSLPAMPYAVRHAPYASASNEEGTAAAALYCVLKLLPCELLPYCADVPGGHPGAGRADIPACLLCVVYCVLLQTGYAEPARRTPHAHAARARDLGRAGDASAGADGRGEGAVACGGRWLRSAAWGEARVHTALHVSVR